MEIKVTIFDDSKLIRDALQAILAETPGMVCSGAFDDPTRWEKEILRTQPDVVLMDIEMPEMDGIEATRKICEKFPGIRVLILTVFDDPDKIFLALCAGASGYILKNDSPFNILQAIQDVFNGGTPLSPTVAKKMLSFFSNKNVILVVPKSEDYQLSTRENEMLQMIVKGDNFKSIAEKSFISYETVRTHFRNIYKKLHVSSRSEAVMKAIQQGLV